MSAFFLSSLMGQGLVMAVDEFYFHWKRGLPSWERWGHPVDTFFYLIPFLILSFTMPDRWTVFCYTIFSVLSCLIITKDEWVHREQSPPAEQWLHSILFILHPVVLISAFFCWTELQHFMKWVAFAIFGFFIYQVIYWNVIYANRVLKAR